MMNRSEVVRYTYCPDPLPIPPCVKYGDISSVCFQNWIAKYEEMTKELAEGQKWRWGAGEKGKK